MIYNNELNLGNGKYVFHFQFSILNFQLLLDLLRVILRVHFRDDFLNNTVSVNDKRGA